jgi:hypothetical protein
VIAKAPIQHEVMDLPHFDLPTVGRKGANNNEIQRYIFDLFYIWYRKHSNVIIKLSSMSAIESVIVLMVSKSLRQNSLWPNNLFDQGIAKLK